MSEWHLVLFAALGAAAVVVLHKIFLEVRSIRRMMNHDRRISNEVRSFDD